MPRRVLGLCLVGVAPDFTAVGAWSDISAEASQVMVDSGVRLNDGPMRHLHGTRRHICRMEHLAVRHSNTVSYGVIVTPANAWVHLKIDIPKSRWIPAFAGMTDSETKYVVVFPTWSV
jgi:hypothetical protein